MNYLEVKTEIITKFNTVRNFASVSGIDEMYIHNLFKRCEYKMTQAKKVELDQILQLSNRINDSLPENIIKTTERNRLKVNIDLQYSGVKDFCEKNPLFSPVTVYEIINGTRKRKTALVKQLFNMFNIL